MRTLKWILTGCAIFVIGFAAYKWGDGRLHVAPLPTAAEVEQYKTHWIQARPEHVLLPASAVAEFSEFYLGNRRIVQKLATKPD